MTNPTPGPWKAIPWHKHGLYSICTADDVVLGEVCHPNATANAHLIAAAPALLAVCEATLEYWQATGFAECGPGCACVVDQMRAAIASARPRAGEGE
jgi:hypothetical protein